MPLALRVVIWIVGALAIGFVVSLIWDGLGAPQEFRIIGIGIGVAIFLAVEELVVRRLRKS